MEKKSLKHNFYRFVLKRFFDVIFSIVGILTLTILIWWWVIIVNIFVTKAKPFFFQKRIGYKEKIFTIVKFRTMRNDTLEIATSDATEDFQKNITSFGRFLRKTSIDETPQLFNVLIGQMSLIGPRPGLANGEEYLHDLRKSYVPSAYYAKPGISGYSQTHLKRAHDPNSKAFHDSWYVKNLCFWIDFKIFFLSILSLFGFNCGR